MATQRNILSFEPNIAYDVVLKYRTGRQISNGNIMFSTVSDEVFFLNPEEANRVHELALADGEPVRIMKRIVNGDKTYVIGRVPQTAEQPVARPAAPATSSQRANSSESPADQPQKEDISLSHRLASCYIIAIDALQLAAEYAKAKGLSLRITEEEIRTAAHCAFIEAGKAQERELREREFTCRYAWQNGREPVNGGATPWRQQ
jgi:hypothetical protein